MQNLDAQGPRSPTQGSPGYLGELVISTSQLHQATCRGTEVEGHRQAAEPTNLSSDWRPFRKGGFVALMPDMRQARTNLRGAMQCLGIHHQLPMKSELCGNPLVQMILVAVGAKLCAILFLGSC